MTSFPDSFESEFLLDFLKRIPLNFTECHTEIKNMHLDDLSLQEENQTLLREFKHIEIILKKLVGYVEEYVGQSQMQVKAQTELNNFLKNKLETTIMKLNNYKKCKVDLMQQNQDLLEKIQSLNEALDEQERKSDLYLAKLSHVNENFEVIQRKKQMFEILNTEKSIQEYFRNNIEEIRKEYPSYFCKCEGNYESLKTKFHDLSQKHQLLQSHYDNLQTNNSHLSTSIGSLIEENQVLQVLLSKQSLQKKKPRTSVFRSNNSNQSSIETLEKSLFKRNTKRSGSVVLGKKKKKKGVPLEENLESKESLICFQETDGNDGNEETSPSGTGEFKEDSHSLLFDMENSTISKQDTKDLLNDQGYSEYLMQQKTEILEKFNNMELDSPAMIRKMPKDKIPTSPTFTAIKVQSIVKELQIPAFEEIQPISSQHTLRYSDMAIYAVIASANIWFKVLGRMVDVLKRK